MLKQNFLLQYLFSVVFVITVLYPVVTDVTITTTHPLVNFSTS